MLGVVVLLLVWRKPIVIGVVMSRGTALGIEGNLAARLYRDLEPAVATGRVRYRIANPPLEEAAFRQSCHELVDAGATVLVGGMISDTGLWLAAVAEERGVAAVGVTASTERLSGRDDHFVRLMMDTQSIGLCAAAYIQDQGYRRVLVVAGARNRSYTQSEAASLQTAVGDAVVVIDEADLQTAADWTAVIAPPVDAVYLAMAPVDHYLWCERIRAERPELALLGGEWAAFLYGRLSGPAVEGVTYITRRGPTNTVFAAQHDAYRSRHRQVPGVAAELTFACLHLVQGGIEQVGGDPDRLLAYWRRIGRADGPYGLVRFDATGDVVQPSCFVHRVQEGRLQLVARIDNPLFGTAP